MTNANDAQDCDFCSSTSIASEFASVDSFRAIYNIAPILPGHSLIIPRAHIRTVRELHTTENFCEFWEFAREVTYFLLKTLGTDSFDWTIQELEPAGQTVPHLHLHVIPRKPDDLPEPGDWYPRLRKTAIIDDANEAIDSGKRKRLSSEELREIANELNSAWMKR